MVGDDAEERVFAVDDPQSLVGGVVEDVRAVVGVDQHANASEQQREANQETARHTLDRKQAQRQAIREVGKAENEDEAGGEQEAAPAHGRGGGVDDWMRAGLVEPEGRLRSDENDKQWQGEADTGEQQVKLRPWS